MHERAFARTCAYVRNKDREKETGQTEKEIDAERERVNENKGERDKI